MSFFFFSSRRRHTRFKCDWSSDVCSSDLVCSPQTVGKCSGEWVPFGRAHDQAPDQREDDARSLTFETPPLDRPIEILGAPIVTLDLASDRPIANLVIRLCDVHQSAESLPVT